MKQLRTITRKISNKTLEAGIFFMLFATVPVQAQDVSEGLQGGVRDANPETTGQDLMGIFQTIANILLFLLGAIAVIMLIIGGFRYVVSGGDSNAVESAKNTILYAIVGIVVAFLAWAAVDFVIDQLQN